MTNPKTCYIAAHEVLDKDYLKDLFDLVEKLEWEHCFKLKDDPDVILYGGGVDINPRLYGEKPLETTQTPFPLRDGMEIHCYQWSQWIADKPAWNVGICRGMQLLTVLNGGKLAQHIEGHDVASDDKATPVITHQVEYLGANKKDTYGTVVNSFHHQMIKPPANGKEKHNPYQLLAQTIGVLNDPEAIYFPKTLSLGVQWHPEWSEEGGSWRLFKRIMDDYILNEKEAA
jgi:putative glutamine amidotransferase